jgi:hypothetical protein
MKKANFWTGIHWQSVARNLISKGEEVKTTVLTQIKVNSSQEIAANQAIEARANKKVKVSILKKW